VESKAFWVKYITEFGQRPFKDNQTDVAMEWDKLIEKISPYNTEDIFRVVGELLGNSVAAPKARVFRKAISQIVGHRRWYTDNCQMCFDHTGLLMVLAYKDDHGWHLGLGGDYCSVVTVCCTCDAGRKFMARDVAPEMIPEVLKRSTACVEWVRGMRDEAFKAGVMYPLYLEKLAMVHNKKVWGDRPPLMVRFADGHVAKIIAKSVVPAGKPPEPRRIAARTASGPDW